MSRISNGTALHASLDGFVYNTLAANFGLLVAFAIPLVRTLRYFSRAVKIVPTSFGDFTHRHRFCTGARMEMALRVIESLVAEFAARKRLSLFNNSIMAALFSFDRPLLQSSCLTSIVGEVLERQNS